MADVPTSERDAGMTLIELLVSVLAIGAIVVVLSAAIVVTLRQQSDTTARTDVARWEQALALWMPTDLASAGLPADAGVPAVDDDPTASPSPCSIPACTFGSNALLLRWGNGNDRTTVSYRFGPASSGGGYVMTRVECDAAGSCSSNVVLRDLAAPPPPWNPGDEVPDAIINVTIPLDVDSTDGGTTDATSVAQRLVITVNGDPDVDGIDRSSTISFTAGGTVRGTIPPPAFEGPTFIDAKSGCGGPITLVVDESGSIGGADSSIEAAVENFIDTFDGTPTRLQVIEFSGTARVVGSGSAWNRFYDLSQPSEVSALKSALDINSGGSTNWEDALFRTFYAQNGLTYAQLGDPNAPTPELVIFFTDGEPTRDREDNKSDSAPTNPPTVPSPYNHQGNNAAGDLSPYAWYRADWVADQFRSVRLIGIGAGPNFNGSTSVRYNGWPRTGGNYTPIPNRTFLGDLVSGGDPSLYGTGGSGNYVLRDFEAQGGSWGDVSNADLLVTTNLNNVSSALSEIALSECGGTLTVQTRDATTLATSGIDVTYRIGVEQSTTSAIRKAATFDVAIGAAATTVELIPTIDTPGWSADSWSCTSRGVDLGGGYSPIDTVAPIDPGEGINVTVDANGAVSCTLFVSAP